jgi:transposase
VARAKNGQAISDAHRTVEERMQLAIVLEGARTAGDLVTWRRAKAITEYMEGVRVVDIVKMIDVGRSTINTWLRLYETQGVEGLIARKPPGAKSRLTPEQRQELKTTLAQGPQTAGFTSGVWTGPLVRQYVWEHFGVDYHIHHLPWLLHKLGFSVQRPRKKLARADAQAQALWIEERLPAIKKKPRTAAGS